MIIGKRNEGPPLVEVIIRHDTARWEGDLQSIPAAKATALIDTGASHTVVHPRVIEHLGLKISRPFTHRTVGGRSVDINAYGCDITIDRDVGPCTVADIDAMADIPLDCDVLLGWDFLRFFDMHFLSTGRFILVWRGK